ncbi:nuclear transport factor 2-like protein [Actinacidiphila yanglinensis]|nr:nuclear transport factor 2 family protein [Actinacidiphila yanglinensis]
MKNDNARFLSRRSALTAVAAGSAALAGTWMLPGSAEAAPGISAEAPAGIRRLFSSFLTAKSAADVDRTMAFFSRSDMTYWDATAGFSFPDWATLKGVFENYMPNWGPDAHSYQTDLLGSETGAALFFTNSPQEFGQEIRGISVVDIREGKFVRWIDYWDGRHFGISELSAFRSPPAQFPSDFGWTLPGENASSPLKRTVAALSRSAAAGDHQRMATLFDANGVLEDLTLHTAVAGPKSIAAYLKQAVSNLPYGQRARVRHVVGGSAGGAYEWTNSSSPIPRGASALQLNADGKITRLSSIWDGSLVDAGWLTQRMAETIER